MSFNKFLSLLICPQKLQCCIWDATPTRFRTKTNTFSKFVFTYGYIIDHNQAPAWQIYN